MCVAYKRDLLMSQRRKGSLEGDLKSLRRKAFSTCGRGNAPLEEKQAALCHEEVSQVEVF